MAQLETLIAGLMCGTSVDAIDVALCRFVEDTDAPGRVGLELLNYSEQPIPDELRRQVFEAFAERIGPAELCELNFWLGEAFGSAALSAIEAAGLAAAQFDLLASHGQTIYHQVAVGHRRSTLQMAEATVIAARTGLTVAHDFRTADMAAGGQGAPLVPYFDLVFFGGETTNRALQNIGGIGNLTWLPAGGGPDEVLAFDTGPGNALIDAAARLFSDGRLNYDRDGGLAAQGAINSGWLAELLRHPYFELPPPKSTGREVFGDVFARQAVARAADLGLSQADTMATLTAFTAKSIAQSVRRFLPGSLNEMIVSGGGARNPVLMEGLGEWLPGVTVRPHDDFGLPAEAKEAVAFALLGYELLRNRPANLPRCTGARAPVLLGKLTPGLRFAPLLQKYSPHMIHQEENARWPTTTPRLHLL